MLKQTGVPLQELVTLLPKVVACAHSLVFRAGGRGSGCPFNRTSSMQPVVSKTKACDGLKGSYLAFIPKQ